MAHFIVGVVGNVLRHVPIELFQRSDVEKTRPARHFHASEFVILLPEISLDDLRRSREPQDRDVPVGYQGALRLPERSGCAKGA